MFFFNILRLNPGVILAPWRQFSEWDGHLKVIGGATRLLLTV